MRLSKIWKKELRLLGWGQSPTWFPPQLESAHGCWLLTRPCSKACLWDSALEQQSLHWGREERRGDSLRLQGTLEGSACHFGATEAVQPAEAGPSSSAILASISCPQPLTSAVTLELGESCYSIAPLDFAEKSFTLTDLCCESMVNNTRDFCGVET